MGLALFLIGILAIIAGIVMFIVALVRKSGWGVVRSLAIGGVGLILAVVGVVVGITQEAPPTGEAGESRLNPVPFGSSLTYMDEQVTVINSRRVTEIGWSTPDADNIFLIVNVKVDFSGEPTEKKHYLFTSDFRVVDSGGHIYDAELFIETDTPLKSGEFYGGATTSGNLVYEVGEQETNLVLIWNCGLGVDRYFEIP
jgi:hypothetical protein